MSAFFLGHPKETDLALFAGGESGPFARWRIERHVETCERCEQTVADYFHLADELSVLADTPDLDWSAMSAGIRARLAEEAREPAPRKGIPAWTWQLGAAAACAMVAVAVLRIDPAAEKAQAPAPKTSIAGQTAAEEAFVADSISAPAATAPSEKDLDSESNEIASARQLIPLEAEAAPRGQAQPEPLLEKKKEAVSADTLAFADRADERLATDAAAPPPPAAKAMTAEKSSVETISEDLAPEERRAREPLAVGRVIAGAAPAPPASPAALGSAMTFAGSLGAAQPAVAFSVMPLPAAREDRQVGADGWISIRAVTAEGAMTITDVYEPQ